jgi:hypothetical protein
MILAADLESLRSSILRFPTDTTHDYSSREGTAFLQTITKGPIITQDTPDQFRSGLEFPTNLNPKSLRYRDT